MNILFLAAQAPALAKAGGLTEAAGSLPAALAALGHAVRVAVPSRAVTDPQRLAPRAVARITVPHVSGDQVARVSQVQREGVTYYLIAGPARPRAARGNGADPHAAAAEFVFVSLAALGLCRALDWSPDVVHGLDPAAGPALYWLDTDGQHDPVFQPTASVFTLPDLAHTHGGAGRTLRAYGLTASDSPLLPDWARDTLLGLGLAHAGLLTTTSPAAAREVVTPEFGQGLQGLLLARRDRLAGIPNGLDLDRWDPGRDPHLAARYDGDRLDRRAANKRALQKSVGLRVAARLPVIGLFFGREAPADFDSTLAALRTLLAGPASVQLVVLGTLPRGDVSRAVAAELRRLAAALPDRVRVQLGFDAARASLILGGADVLLVPARGDPDGLAAGLALRYGAVPVVGADGAAAGAVIDQSETRRGNGFVFRDYNAESVLAGLQRALRLQARPLRWRALQRRGMRQALEFFWARSAQNYLALYQQAITFRKEAVTTLTQMLADDPAFD